jgi:uncharacterized membrane protein YjjB (DUF3815 family)
MLRHPLAPTLFLPAVRLMTLLGSFVFGVGLGYLMGRYPWVYALMAMLVGLLLMTGPVTDSGSFHWSGFIAAFIGGLIGNAWGLKARHA